MFQHGCFWPFAPHFFSVYYGNKVTKTYRGDMTMVGESVGVTGIMSSTDPIDNSEREVGYFNMIDATNERAGTSE